MQSKLLPDLWLKMELALVLATILPKDAAAPLVNSEFIRYIRGDGDRLSTFNKWLVGDAAIQGITIQGTQYLIGKTPRIAQL